MSASDCGVYGNYSPRKLSPSGIKYNAYNWTLDGVFYQNGQKYIGDGTSESTANFNDASVINTPGCDPCHSS